MDPIIKNYVDPDDILGGELDEIQAAMLELRHSTANIAGAPAGWTPPTTLSTRRIGGIRLFVNAHLGTGGAPTEVVVDNSIDWRDRILDKCWLLCTSGAGSTSLPGGTAYAGPANPYPANPAAFPVDFGFYTGKGCTISIGAGPVIVGPGTAGVGTYVTLAANVWLYARNDGALIFSDSGLNTTYAFYGIIGCTADIGGF